MSKPRTERGRANTAMPVRMVANEVLFSDRMSWASFMRIPSDFGSSNSDISPSQPVAGAKIMNMNNTNREISTLRREKLQEFRQDM